MKVNNKVVKDERPVWMLSVAELKNIVQNAVVDISDDEELREPFILEDPQIIPTNISDRIIVKLYDEEFSTTPHIKSNNYVDAKNIKLRTNSIRYSQKRLKPNTLYTIQLNCVEYEDVMLTVNLCGTVREVDITGIDYINIEIITPEVLESDALELIGEGIKVNNVMLFEGKTIQTPTYFDGKKEVGIINADGNYELNISSTDDENNFEISVVTNKPLGVNDRLYWNNKAYRYEIDRNGEIEVPTVNGDTIDLPRLYQKNGTNIRVETGSINPSVIEIEYIDIN
jgi:hypothetical protein